MGEMNGVGSSTAGGSDEYFTSYDDLEIHRLMLEDTPRTTAYQRAIENVDLKGKVVMGKFNGVLSHPSDGITALSFSPLSDPIRIISIIRLKNSSSKRKGVLKQK